MTAALFYFIACLTIISALFVVLNRNPVYSAVMLVFCFFSLAALYVLLEAYFVAVLEIIVYAGAIMVLFLFVIMLINVGKETAATALIQKAKALPFVLVVLFSFNIILLILWRSEGLHQPNTISSVGGITAIGQALFTKYLLPFEIASLLLLVALIGTVYLAKRRVS
jgi:NADH-quinone oxidoreductase subunit J|tara:strand:+ start:106 stop:606 length:501 start_codon:yes stop_codon:yes gene_type:complete